MFDLHMGALNTYLMHEICSIKLKTIIFIGDIGKCILTAIFLPVLIFF